MKQISIILAVMLFSVMANAQVKSLFNKQKLTNSQKNTIKNVKETIFVEDSVKNYEYNLIDDVWEAKSKSFYTERYTDGRLKTVINLDSTTAWVNRDSSSYSYLTNSVLGESPFINVNVLVQKIWNSDLSIFSDTIYYVDNTEYLNEDSPEGRTVENFFISKDYNYNTNEYQGGFHVKITLFHDSLYSKLEVRPWDVENNIWLNIISIIDYNYDDNDFLSSVITKDWNETSNSFENYGKDSYTWENGYKTQELYQEWNGTEWENINKTDYTYDANHNILSITAQNWESSAWKNNYRYSYTYDSNNNKIEYISEINDNGNLVNNNKDTYTYDENIVTAITSSYWNTTDNQWVNSYKTEYTYNAFNFITNKAEKIWSISTSTWTDHKQTVTEYNANNDITAITKSDWDYTSSDWKITYWKDNTYDATNGYLLTEFEKELNTDNNNLENTNKHIHYWSEFEAVGIKSVENTNFKVYPNPTTGVVNISLKGSNIKSLKVTNLLGQEVLHTNNSVYRNETLNLKQYGTGIYIVKITDTNNKKYTTKVIVK